MFLKFRLVDNVCINCAFANKIIFGYIYMCPPVAQKQWHRGREINAAALDYK